jgi:subtilisin family serine protease
MATVLPPVGAPPGTVQATTGRFLILLEPKAPRRAVTTLQKRTGLRIAQALEAEPSEMTAVAAEEGSGLVFEHLGVAVVNAAPDQIQAVATATAESTSLLAMEPERIVYAIEAPGALPPSLPAASHDYLHGFQDGVAALAAKVGPGRQPTTAEALPAAGPLPLADGAYTWGLQLAGIPATPYTGKGVRVAVLDTGFDMNHPDFAGRPVQAQSFVSGEPPQDGHGHGTHCIGTACGPLLPGVAPRYGIASDAEIYVGKVLSNQGSGADGDILAGINRAVQNECAVASMSLGAAVAVGTPYSRIFERAASRAISAGTVIVAAAGNDSRRDLGQIAPVGHPANCPSIIAVAAVDSNVAVAYFSNGSVAAAVRGGQVDICGPGVNVRSSWPMPTRYRTISGTSMATPHVAGVVALTAEEFGDDRGWSLVARLFADARRLSLSSADAGVGCCFAAGK